MKNTMRTSFADDPMKDAKQPLLTRHKTLPPDSVNNRAWTYLVPALCAALFALFLASRLIDGRGMAGVAELVFFTLAIMASTFIGGFGFFNSDPKDHGPIEGYTLESSLGEGGFSKVYRASKVFPGDDTPSTVALKFLNIHSAAETNDGIQEGMRMAKCGHKNVVGFKEVFLYFKGATVWNRIIKHESRWALCIALDLCDGDLEGDIQKWAQFSSSWPGYPKVLSTFKEAVEGVDYLHNLGIIHLDLKPGNIFVAPGHERVMIGDLGLAVVSKGKGAKGNFECAGTQGYKAPEVYLLEQGRGQGFSTRADNWSMAHILVDMVRPNNDGGWAVAKAVNSARMLAGQGRLQSLDDEDDIWFGYGNCGKTEEAVDLLCDVEEIKADPTVVKVIRMCLVEDQNKRCSSDQLLAALP